MARFLDAPVRTPRATNGTAFSIFPLVALPAPSAAQRNSKSPRLASQPGGRAAAGQNLWSFTARSSPTYAPRPLYSGPALATR
jgi:hypothetical protein